MGYRYMQEMLQVVDLWVSVEGKQVLKGVDFSMGFGDVCVLFGPNGAGKTSFMMSLMGFPKYKVDQGKIYFKGEDITNKDIYERAKMGIGLSFQRPPTVGGVSLERLINLLSKKNGISDEEVESILESLKIKDHIKRSINDGFSGGEMKRSEILQLMLQKPEFVLIDEPESGVDMENIALVGHAINHLLGKDKVRSPKRGALIITHTGYILDYVNADKGYIFINGRIICSGNPRDMLNEIKRNGYKGCQVCQ
jgi:Fe-S cluster assembly ATP-binding protein